MSRVQASAPGKLILMGEHAAVYGRPVVVATIDLRAKVCAERYSGSRVQILLPDLGLRVALAWEDLATYAERARAAWSDYAAAPTPDRFARVGPAARAGLADLEDLPALEPAHLVLTALGEVALTAGTAELPPISVEVSSELPVGAGFGSSAAIATSVLAAASGSIGAALQGEALADLALEVERRQHGLPSGADHTAVLRGGVLRITRSGDDPLTPDLEVEPLTVAPETLGRFAVFNSGQPEAGTGEVVASVRALRERDPLDFERRLDRMAANVLSFARELEREQPDWSELAISMSDYQACLEEIGVVPPAIQEVLAEARAAGVIGKISGAGGLSDAGAGSVLALGPNEVPSALAGYPVYRAPLGVPGLTVEVVP